MLVRLSTTNLIIPLTIKIIKIKNHYFNFNIILNIIVILKEFCSSYSYKLKNDFIMIQLSD